MIKWIVCYIGRKLRENWRNWNRFSMYRKAFTQPNGSIAFRSILVTQYNWICGASRVWDRCTENNVDMTLICVFTSWTFPFSSEMALVAVDLFYNISIKWSAFSTWKNCLNFFRKFSKKLQNDFQFFLFDWFLIFFLSTKFMTISQVIQSNQYTSFNFLLCSHLRRSFILSSSSR